MREKQLNSRVKVTKITDFSSETLDAERLIEILSSAHSIQDFVASENVLQEWTENLDILKWRKWLKKFFTNTSTQKELPKEIF